MWFKAAGIFFATLFIVFAFLMGCQSQWQRRTQQLVQDFYKPIPDLTEVSKSSVYRPEDELKGLPEPVQRYFQQTLVPEQPLIRDLTLKQAGRINLLYHGVAWKQFTAQQDIIMHSPGFIWQATVNMAPSINAFVINSYRSGRGWLHAKIMGLVTVAETDDERALAEGELIRFLAEAPWFPTRLLPSQGIHWQAINNRSAQATLTDNGLTVSVTFTFDDEFRIINASSEERYRQNYSGESIYAPWESRFSDYRRAGGMLLPHATEAGWIVNKQWLSYWQGEVTDWDIRF